jgi:hypothetical protein
VPVVGRSLQECRRLEDGSFMPYVVHLEGTEW